MRTNKHGGKAVRRQRQKSALCTPRREASEEAKPADSCSLNSTLQNCEKINSVVSPPSLYGSPIKLAQLPVLSVATSSSNAVSGYFWFLLNFSPDGTVSITYSHEQPPPPFLISFCYATIVLKAF